MRILQPNAWLWKQGDNMTQHIAKCARICYASEKGNDEVLVSNLIKKEHFSMFRHWTRAWITPFNRGMPETILKKNSQFILNGYLNRLHNLTSLCPYVRCETINIPEKGGNCWVFVTNQQFVLEHPEIFNHRLFPRDNEVGLDEILKYAPHMYRVTIKVRTQISTTRELNRVSPNNIAEESTRYCNYSLDKFNGEVALCQPHWFNLFINHPNDVDAVIKTVYDRLILFSSDGTDEDISNIFDDANILNKYDKDYLVAYLDEFRHNAKVYNWALSRGILPEDARGELHLDTCTNAVYTYFMDEWKHILDLRLRGTTGRPHPNARLIAGHIDNELNRLQCSDAG